MRGGAFVGTSGWSYPNWRGRFYPRGLKPGEWLRHYAECFPAVELNATFYRLQPPANMARWASLVPPDFRFAVKAWRAITHLRRLAACGDELGLFLDGLAPLGGRCGPILFQLPPSLPADGELLRRFLDRLPQGRRYALEFRHVSWFRDDVLATLERRGVGFVTFDLAGFRSPRLVTGGFAYLRLHGHAERYRGAYGAERLADWARWLAGERASGRDVYAFLDNTMVEDHAVRDAETLAALLVAADATSA